MASAAPAALDRALDPIDGARRRVMRAMLGVPALARVLADKDRRIATVATLGVLFALAVTSFAPALLFALSPILLGVPHVASDVRYLVLRRKLPRWWLWTILAACVSMMGLRIVYEIWLAADGSPSPHLMTAEVAIGGVWVVLAAIGGALRSGSLRRFAIVGPIALGLGALGLTSPYYAILGITHAHNLVAVVLWLVLFRRSARTVAAPLVVFVGAGVLLASGEVLPLAAWSGGLVTLGADLAEVSTWLVPGVPARIALALTVTYVFLQAIHYSVWLGWIPQEDARAEGTLTFRMSARSLVADFRWWGVVVILLGCATVIGFATTDLLRTRDVYLSVAAFHGYLELAMLAYLITAAAVPSRARLQPAR